MGLSARLLILIACCLIPSVAAEVLIASSLLPATIAVPASVAAAVVLACMAGRLLVVRPIRVVLGELERTLPGSSAATSRPAEIEALSHGLKGLTDDLARQDGLHRQRAGLLQAVLAERDQALSASNNRLQVALVEIARAEAARELMERHRLSGQLAGGVAHDFNNLLATVLGCLELMERRLTDPDRLRTLIGRASDAVDRASKLTSGLVHFARRQSQPRRAVDLNGLVADLAPLIASALGRRIRLNTEFAPALGLAHADPAGVEMALVGICLAARAAIPGGGQVILMTCEEPTLEAASAPGPRCALRILAEGEDLGEPQLAEARRTAEQAGAVVLERGGNSKIEISLLLPRAERDIDPRQIVSLPIEPRRRALMLRVLLVDDDDAVRLTTACMLRELGCAVVDAPGGTKALELLEGAARDVDLLVLDYAMPGMNGLELAQTARARGIAAPILLATGYADFAERSDLARTVLDSVLRKPFTIEELHEAIAGLRSRAAQSPNVVLLRTNAS